MPSVVQLEIRGVGGATAEEILGGPVTQTAGNGTAGFYRPEEPSSDGRLVEAYDWGRLTSGTVTSAVWWILLPFTLINVAGWMFQPSEEEGARLDEPVRSSAWLGRLLMVAGGLFITAVYVMWLVTLTTEIVAFGCAAAPDCAARWYLAPVAWFDSNPIWLVTLGVGLAAMLVLGLFVFILRTQDSLEGYEADANRRRVGLADMRRADSSRLRRNTPLDNQGFWYKWAEHRRLFRWHLGLSMLLLGAAAGHAIRRVGWERPPGGVALMILLVGATLLWVVWMLSGPERFREPATDDPGSADETNKRIGWTVAHVGLATTGYGIAWLVSGEAPEPGFAFLGAIRALTGTLYVAAALTIAVLIYRRRRKNRFVSKGTLWLMPGVAAALAIIVAGAGFVAVAHLSGRLLLGGEWVRSNGFDIVLIDIMAVALIVTVACSAYSYWRSPKPIADVRSDYFDDKQSEDLSDRERSWVRSVASARVIARLPAQGHRMLATLVSVMVVLALLQWWSDGFAFGAGPDGAFNAPLFGFDGLGFLHTSSATIIVLYVFPGLQLIRANARSRASRRQLGKVWDVLSFWPRRFHPLAAPCYAERAVPEFRNRIRHHLDDDRRVVVSAHSQGAVIAFAALVQIAAESEEVKLSVDGVEYDSFRHMALAQQEQAQTSREAVPGQLEESVVLGEAPLRRVGLVTFGSPLSTLYGRFFPWHFGTEGRFQALRAKLATLASSRRPAWQSLWRPTDYIGRQVFIDPGGVLTPPDPTADTKVKEALGPLFPYESHSDYEREPQLTSTIELFAGEIQ